MKRILNIIGIFFLSIIVFTGCQNFTEDEMEMSPQTRAQLSSGTHYYWYKGKKSRLQLIRQNRTFFLNPPMKRICSYLS